jgi:hypothetical protein
VQNRLSSKVIFLIPASNALENEKDRISQTETWCQERDSDWNPIWVRGNLEHSWMSNANHTLFVDCEESYRNILQKTILAARWIIHHYDFQFVIRSNVSTYFDRKLTEKALSRFDSSENFFAGFIDETQSWDFNAKSPEKFVTGSGIIMTKSSLEILASAEWVDYDSVPDDVAITRILKNQSVSCISLSRCNLGLTRFFVPNWQVRLKSSTDSELASKRFHYVRCFFISKSWIMKFCYFIRIEVQEIQNWNPDYDSFKVYSRNCIHLIKLFLVRKLKFGVSLE